MDKWSELLVSYDETEVHLVKNILDAENIPVVIDSLKIRPYPVNIGKIGEIRIMVRAEDLKKAQAVLKIMKNLSENA